MDGQDKTNGVTEESNVPPLKFAVRTNNGIELWRATPEVTKEDKFVCTSGQALQFSSDGQLVAVINPDSVVMIHCDTCQTLTTVHEANVISVAFSPQSTFLLTWKRWNKEQQATGTGNVAIWDVKSGERLHDFVQKKAQWPAIQWTEDELLSAKMVSSEVQFFVGQKWDNPVKAIKVPGVEDFAMAPGVSPPTVSVFIPEKKGQPGFARIYKYPKVGEPVSSRALFKAQTVEFLWNSKGTGVLAMTHTSVDRTGKSYYGETGLHFLSTDSSLDCNVSLDVEGPVHDAKWSPDGTQFVVIYGYMPAQATLFNERCQKLADFGRAPRNNARWSPCGRLLALAGFGNLNGQVDVWDVKKVRKIGSAVADCGCSIEWSPDSQLLLTAALSPKIRVDNGYTIWQYDGSVYHRCSFPVLYEAKWQTLAPSKFPLKRIKSAPQGKISPHSSVPAKPAIYQPPSMRGQAPVQNKEELEAQKPRKYRTNQSAAERELPVGAAPESKTALRNKQRRQRRKQKVCYMLLPPTDAFTKGQGSDEVHQDETHDSVPGAGEETKSVDAAKQIRALQKKLRQISLLKEKQAAGQQLDASQLVKLASAPELERELAKLSHSS